MVPAVTEMSGQLHEQRAQNKTLKEELAAADQKMSAMVQRTEYDRLKNEANELSVEWGQLLIEQSTFGVEGRIEQKAIDQLGMRVPDVSQIVMVGQ